MLRNVMYNITMMNVTECNEKGGDSMRTLKKLRLKRGLTQEELADILHVNRTTVTHWENGTNKPRANMLVKLSKVLRCKVDDLLCSETW